MPEFFLARPARANVRILAPRGRWSPLTCVWVGTTVVACALLAALTPGATLSAPGAALIWVALATASELLPIRLPGGGRMTATSVLDHAAIVLFGPVAAAWIGLVAVSLAQGVVQRRQTRRVIFNVASGILSVASAGWIYRSLGGHTGSFALPGHLLPFAGLVIAYFVVNTGLVSVVIGAELERSPWRVWQRNFRWSVPHLAALLPLGVLTIIAAEWWGVAAAVLVVGPLYLARASLRGHVQVNEILEDMSSAMIEVIGEIDPYTRRHSIRVAVYAEQLARALGLPEDEVDRIRLGGLLHDVGKIGQDRQVLLKPLSLTDGERKSMELHPAAGARVIDCVRGFGTVGEIIRHHHERFDGKGYPDRLWGEHIPFGARVVLVADALDAMTSDRAYRRGMPLVVAIAELERHQGSQFDPRVVHTLRRLATQGELRVLRGDLEQRLDRTPH